MTQMDSSHLNFDHLTSYQKRKFVSENIDFHDVEQIKGIYQALLNREIKSAQDLEQWILDRSEFEAALDQYGSVLYIKMTCQTDDQKRAQDYKDFIENIIPAIKPLDHQVDQRFLNEFDKYPLDEDRYAILYKTKKVNVDLFVDKNIPLQTKVELLSQEYQTICGAMTVNFEDKERTMPEMAKFLFDPDRSLRERAWRAMAQRRLKDQEQLDDVFDQMLKLRAEIATNANCQNFCEYKFKSLHRFDYTPEECKQYHDTIKKSVVPIWKQILDHRKKQMKVDTLRPWDTSVDPLGREPLKPFERVDDLIDGCKRIFYKVDEELGKQFDDMVESKVLDLESRKGKAPGGYQSTLNESRKPFIFMNSVGLDGDVRTLLHECGHAFHAMACAQDPLVDYRHGPMEFNEVASMAMELLGGKYIQQFYNKDDAERSSISHLEDIVHVLIWVATIDSFQHWIYENPTHSREQRNHKWLEIRDKFGANFINWGGLREEATFLWHRQLHIFEVPFYYIEYGIAQLGALQVWLNAQNDWKDTILKYRAGLALGGSKSVPRLYEMSGIKFDFSQDTIIPLMENVQNQLEKFYAQV